MLARGGRPVLTRSSSADRAENPTSRRVTVVIRTRPRWILDAHSSASSLWARRTRADLSINHPSPPRVAHDLRVVEVGEGLREAGQVVDGHAGGVVGALA